MGIRESYENGVFNWVDLATTDLDAAKQFYARLFNWDFQDMPNEQFLGHSYSVAFKNNRNVAALFGMPDEMRAQNIPPHWESHINVKDLEASVQSWQSHGGVVLNPPFDVMDFGRMAVVKDPTGAVVNLWQAKAHIGAGLVNEVNTFCWNELQTRGSEKAAQFYQAVFDWEIEIEEKPPYYVACKVKGRHNCGMFDLDKANLPDNIPSNWAVYFNVENLDACLDLVNSMGGEALIEPITLDVGRFTTMADPQGAVLTIIELTEFDD